MSITSMKYPPNTIFLGGGHRTQVNDLAASETITPGMLIERFNAAGVIRFKKHATAGQMCHTIATDQSMMNLGVDSAYAANDLVEASVLGPGATFWGLIASGANIAAGDMLASAGNGKLQAVGGGTPTFKAIENKNNSAGPGDARIRVEVQ